MRISLLIGVLLIALGAVSLAYHGITYTEQKKVLDLGPIQATKETEHTIPLPPVFGGIAVLGGIALLVADKRRGA